MNKLLLAGGIFLGGVLAANAQELKDPCGSPKEFYSKYLLDKCYKVYFDAISESKRKAEEANAKASDALNKSSRLEAIIEDHENRIRQLERRPITTPEPRREEPKREEGIGVYRWQLEEIGTVKFDFDRFDIRRDQLGTLDQIASRAKESGAEVLVVGFADTAGSAKYNFNLSMWRAQKVASELARRGVDIGKMNIAAYGKEIHDLLDPRNPSNQRVVKVYIKR